MSDYNIIHTTPSTTQYIIFNLSSHVEHEDKFLAYKLLKSLKVFDNYISNYETITSSVYNTVTSSYLVNFSEEKISGYNIPTKRLYTKANDYVISNIKLNEKNTFVLSTAIKTVFNDYYMFPDNLLYNHDDTCYLQQNMIQVLMAKLNAFKDNAQGCLDDFLAKANALLPEMTGVSIPPGKKKKQSKNVPDDSFWEGLQKKIEKIPDHTTVEDGIKTAIAGTCCGLQEVQAYIQAEGKKYNQQMNAKVQADVDTLKTKLITDVTLQYGLFNFDYNKQMIQSKIDLELAMYKKEKDIPYENKIINAGNIIYSGISGLAEMILNTLQITLQGILQSINQVLEWIENLFLKMMSSVTKNFDFLLKPATPPTDLPSVIQWCTAVAKIFNKPLVDMAEVVVNITTHMIKIINALIKKLMDSKSLLLDCVPSLAPLASSPPSLVTGLLTHFINKDSIGVDISKLKIGTNPNDLANSVQEYIGSYFKSDADRILQNTKKQTLSQLQWYSSLYNSYLIDYMNYYYNFYA